MSRMSDDIMAKAKFTEKHYHFDRTGSIDRNKSAGRRIMGAVSEPQSVKGRPLFMSSVEDWPREGIRGKKDVCIPKAETAEPY